MFKFKKFETSLKVLEILGHISLSSIDLLDFFFSGGIRMKKSQFRELNRRMEKRHYDLDLQIENRKEKHKFYSLLNRLQKEGLIKKTKSENKTFWSITKLGIKNKSKLLDLISKKQSINLPVKNYQVQDSNSLILVIFDIPEKEKEKRSWLREVLKNLKFTMVQKSVWMGEKELPVEFLEDAKQVGILSYIKIFSVLKQGNLKE